MDATVDKIAFIKLGGSLITDKARPYTERRNVISRLVEEIKEILKLEPGMSFVLGNGAGSFAHPSAAKYRTKEGFLNKDSKYGSCVVQHDAVTINRIVVDRFLKKKVSVMGVSPHALMLSSSRKLESIWLEQIADMLKKGIIPVVHGDVLLDKSQGVSIFSCDKVLQVIVKNLDLSSWKEVFFVSVGSFSGVLDGKNRVIKELTPRVFDKLVKEGAFVKTKHVDVTGGMRTKIEELAEISKLGIKTLVIDGRDRGSLKKLFLEKKVMGTELIGWSLAKDR